MSRAALSRAGPLQYTEVLDLALPDQVLDCAGDLLDRHVGIKPVLVERT